MEGRRGRGFGGAGVGHRVGALVAAMAGDGWPATRTRAARLLGRGDARAERAMLEALDEDTAVLTPGTRRDVTTAWTTRLRDLLRADPEAARVLRELLAVAPGSVTASGSGVAAGRDVHIRAVGGGVAVGTLVYQPRASRCGWTRARPRWWAATSS
jgi:hypothetical protein